ncbi:integral membrane sensor signal transduction histidine kinase [Scytonema sp. HK-05]|uniref:sensor histidine kinase n=1 Tax=Scytonema sp. HK-05 TaxID=1137095 RepID=UPI000937E876|nr:ATP-binding protein [Scytonema sp. HK-05]OKH57693.1 two-component sensor histidine kinase [Scytonema sp. HK-05]BAY44371.1 integral membrane sensor signal transduction histidine kinase [Scytonema sp. HK-05]
MFQATRRRLALWYTAITAILLLLFASGVYLYVRSTLVERIDDTLNHVVEVVERSLVIEPVKSGLGQLGVNVEASFRDNTDTAEDDRIDLEWFSPTGELLWSTFSQPLNIPLHPNQTGETVKIVRKEEEQKERGTEGGKVLSLPHSLTPSLSPTPPLLLRQVTERVQIGRQVLGYLRVSHPWFEVTKPSRQLILDLAWGTGLMVLSVAASGWFLSGKAMEPVRESYQRLKQFTADASHELRSPITLIQTNVQVALSELELAEADGNIPSHFRQQLKVVERLTQRLGKLVNDLLFLARQDSGISKESFSPCPVDALLMEVVEEQQLLAVEKGIILSLDFIDPPAEETHPELLDNWFTVVGNWDQLVRLFTNLIGNALQYTPSGGRVDVELARIEATNRVSGLRYNTAHLLLKVRDTGIGIPAEELPRLFDRFYRVDPARTHTVQTKATQSATGSGLGLAIALAIVEKHHGQIQVESTQGIGSTVTVTLPVTLES